MYYYCTILLCNILFLLHTLVYCLHFCHYNKVNIYLNFYSFLAKPDNPYTELLTLKIDFNAIILRPICFQPNDAQDTLLSYQPSPRNLIPVGLLRSNKAQTTGLCTAFIMNIQCYTGDRTYTSYTSPHSFNLCLFNCY